MSTDELRIRLAADGRIECRRGDAAPALTFDPHFFGRPDSNEAQAALGRFVFALLQTVAPAAADTRDAVLPADDPDSPAALYQQFVDLQNRAMKEYSDSLLAMAEQALQRSAAGGFEQAIDALKDWPTIKGVANMMFARGPQ
ncbi:hypothetical protein [Methyloversatilis thermotolerans]|uniref:hypothetical protein n=1 Tax=Methyloversatilis thermotolerans TaxID=1346290 RepID=UPI00037EEDE3|nr:hypothetical protein [Methyloversatilis thermotolerans]